MDCSKGEGSSHGDEKRYKGIRRRKWGKWVSEIRIPGTRERLWLGSYTNPEAAAIAYDTAMFCLRGPSSANLLNFPSCLPSYLQADMSPKSIQRAASNAAMAVDFELGKRATQGADDKAVNEGELQVFQTETCEETDDIVHGMNNDFHKTSEEDTFNISFDDMEMYLG